MAPTVQHLSHRHASWLAIFTQVFGEKHVRPLEWKAALTPSPEHSLSPARSVQAVFVWRTMLIKRRFDGETIDSAKLLKAMRLECHLLLRRKINDSKFDYSDDDNGIR